MISTLTKISLFLFKALDSISPFWHFQQLEDLQNEHFTNSRLQGELKCHAHENWLNHYWVSILIGKWILRYTQVPRTFWKNYHSLLKKENCVRQRFAFLTDCIHLRKLLLTFTLKTSKWIYCEKNTPTNIWKLIFQFPVGNKHFILHSGFLAFIENINQKIKISDIENVLPQNILVKLCRFKKVSFKQPTKSHAVSAIYASPQNSNSAMPFGKTTTMIKKISILVIILVFRCL